MLIPLLLGLFSGTESDPTPPPLALERWPAPAGRDGLWPRLAVGRELHVTWTEQTEELSRLLESSHALGPTSGWDDPVVVARSDDWFVNWADFPALAVLDDGRRIATWLQKLGAGTYAYSIRFAVSEEVPSSDSFGPERWLPSDRSESEHGFVSLQALGGPRVFAAWLDGRHAGGGHGEGHSHGGHGHGGAMALYAATIELGEESNGPGAEVMLDDRVCDCCPVASLLLPEGEVLVAYRDRSEDERRDIAVVIGRPDDPDSWSKPVVPQADGWLMPACPVNGPSLAGHADSVALGWFTGADQVAACQVSVSEDRGRTFTTPFRVDEGRPLGRVQVAYLADGTLVAAWLEQHDGGARWLARAVDAQGRKGELLEIARATGQRGDGCLQMVAHGSRAFVAWRAPEAESGLGIAAISLR